jgi:hypothetical protein
MDPDPFCGDFKDAKKMFSSYFIFSKKGKDPEPDPDPNL